jgi:type IV secretory pathway TrbL component
VRAGGDAGDAAGAGGAEATGGAGIVFKASGIYVCALAGAGGFGALATRWRSAASCSRISCKSRENPDMRTITQIGNAKKAMISTKPIRTAICPIKKVNIK